MGRRRSAIELGLADDEKGARGLEPDLVDRAEHAVKCSRRFTFQVTNALSVWDEEHTAAFLRWCQLPFWP